MKTIIQIKNDYPNIFSVLGEQYIDSLKYLEGKLMKNATINPYFSLYSEDLKDIEYFKRLDQSLSKLIKNKENLVRINKLNNRDNDVNISNFINEIQSMAPIIDKLIMVDETENNGKSPDFELKLYCNKIGIECVSYNENEETTKEKNKHLNKVNREIKDLLKNITNDVIHTSLFSPNYKYTLNSRINKFRKMKSGKQLKFYKYKIVVYSFSNEKMDPNTNSISGNNLQYGFSTGLIFNAFYGKKDSILFHPP